MNGWYAPQLPGNNDAEDLIRHMLHRLLSGDFVDGLLVPLRTPDGRNVVPTLVHDPDLLARAAPLAPVMPVNAGTVLGQITVTGGLGRVGAVMRNCELRTAVELAKVQQVDLDHVVTIGVDCLGTYRVEEYAQMVEDGLDPTASALVSAAGFKIEPMQGHSFRPACDMCVYPVPGAESYAPHIAIGLLGTPTQERLWVSVQDESIADFLGVEPAEEPASRLQAVQALLDTRRSERERRIAAVDERLPEAHGLLAEFSTCIGCQNCKSVCPICYCKECIFQTDTFDHPSPRYWDWAECKGGVRLPSDTLLYHVTRMLHMAHACVGCGMCSDGCPVGIPVADIFTAVGQRIQERFDYVPGRDPDEEMIIATFREDELGELGV